MMTRFKISDIYRNNVLDDIKRVDTKINIKSTKYEYFLDKVLKNKLDILLNDLSDNDDAVIIIFGPEGAGKTYLESQIYDYVNFKLGNKYSIDDIHFDGQTYMDKSLTSKKKTVKCMDESRRALNKMRTTSGNNVNFMDFLSECRSQNQVHIILLPAYTDLDQYVAIHRVKLLLSVEKHRDKVTKRLKRGIFNIWSTKKKWLLKKAWDGKYKEPPKSMHIHKGKFDKVFCFDEKEYEAKKEQAKKDRYMTQTKEIKLTEQQEYYLNEYLNGKTYEQIAKERGVTIGAVQNSLTACKKKGFLPEGMDLRSVKKNKSYDKNKLKDILNNKI